MKPLILAFLLGVAAAPAVAACPPAPAAARAPDAAQPRLSAALRASGRLSVLVLGSASTVAPDGYAAALGASLRAARPDLRLRLVVQGARGQDAATALAVLRKSMLSKAPAGGGYNAVLWQVGTVDAIRGARPDDLADTLEAGADLVRAHGAALVLIDPQFSRFLRANIDLEPYETVLRAVALAPDAMLFPRYATMEAWVESDGLDPERAPPGAAPAVAARLAACLGQALARFLLAAGPH